MKRELFQRLLAAREAKRAAVVLTHLTSGAQTLWYLDEPAPVELSERLRVEAERATRWDRCATVDTGYGPVFVHPFNPPLRMILVGAVHIAQALAQIAAIAGFEVVVVDPRDAFATQERFPGVTLRSEWPNEALASLEVDARTAVVTLTHDPKLDDPALSAALNSNAFYIGALGSTKTHESRRRRLAKAGFSNEQVQRVNGPVGLSIGAQSAAEIAVSILAQVIATLRVEEPAGR
jgi:xanthine dehydrogenase accessory factor